MRPFFFAQPPQRMHVRFIRASMQRYDLLPVKYELIGFQCARRRTPIASAVAARQVLGRCADKYVGGCAVNTSVAAGCSMGRTGERRIAGFLGDKERLVAWPHVPPARSGRGPRHQQSSSAPKQSRFGGHAFAENQAMNFLATIPRSGFDVACGGATVIQTAPFTFGARRR